MPSGAGTAITTCSPRCCASGCGVARPPLRWRPDTTLRARPRLLILLAWLLPNTGALADAARYRAEAEALLADNPDPVLRSEFLALRLQPLIYQERTGEVIALGRQVLQHLPTEHFFHC